MKNFVELFNERHDKELTTLRIIANIAGRESPDDWNEYVKAQVAIIMFNDNKLADKLVDSVCEMLVREFRLMPDLNYQLTEKDKAICAVAKLEVEIAKLEAEMKHAEKENK